MHPEVRVHDTTVFVSRHSTRHCRVEKRLGATAHFGLEFSVGEKVEVMIEKGIIIVLNYRGERLSLDEA